VDSSTNIFAKYETGSLSTVDPELSRKTTTTTTTTTKKNQETKPTKQNKTKQNKTKKDMTVCFKPSLPPGEFFVFTCSYDFCCYKNQKGVQLAPQVGS